MKPRPCAYCGSHRGATRDHVVPRSLYPLSTAHSKVQRITVPTCTACNASWSDDEVHFRNILLLCGEPTAVVRELWEGPTRRSFVLSDGHRRVRQLVTQMVPVQMPEGERHKVYPGQDQRVVRIVRKVIRGLCYHHKLPSPVDDSQVYADILKFTLPPELLLQMKEAHADEKILQYRFYGVDSAVDKDTHSYWTLTFFQHITFIGIVYRSADARKRVEAESRA